MNYLDMEDIWEKKTYKNSNFKKELENMKKINIKINEIISLYDYLGNDDDEKYFEDVENAIRREDEANNAENQIQIEGQENLNGNNYNYGDDNFDDNYSDNGIEERDYI